MRPSRVTESSVNSLMGVPRRASGDTAALRALVAGVNQRYRDRTDEYWLEALGGWVVHEVFDNDPEQVRRKGRKHPRYRALAQHPDLEISAYLLWQATFVMALWHIDLPDDSMGLAMPTLFKLLNISDPHMRETLTVGAANNNWSCAQVERELRKLKAAHPSPAQGAGKEHVQSSDDRDKAASKSSDSGRLEDLPSRIVACVAGFVRIREELFQVIDRADTFVGHWEGRFKVGGDHAKAEPIQIDDSFAGRQGQTLRQPRQAGGAS